MELIDDDDHRLLLALRIRASVMRRSASVTSLVLGSALTPSLASRSRSVALRGETGEKPGLLAGGGGGGGPEAACCMDIGDERPVDGVYGVYWEVLLVRKEAELTVDSADTVDRVLVRV